MGMIPLDAEFLKGWFESYKYSRFAFPPHHNPVEVDFLLSNIWFITVTYNCSMDTNIWLHWSVFVVVVVVFHQDKLHFAIPLTFEPSTSLGNSCCFHQIIPQQAQFLNILSVVLQRALIFSEHYFSFFSSSMPIKNSLGYPNMLQCIAIKWLKVTLKERGYFIKCCLTD